MQRRRSISFHLSAVFCLFFTLVIALGMFGIGRLHEFNKLALNVTELWLPKTRTLGDLNNFTSDFRAAEAGALLAPAATGEADAGREIAPLDRSIARAQRSYEKIPLDAEEAALYAKFEQAWHAYRQTAARVLALAGERRGEAAEQYMTASREAYDTASDTLGQLTNRTVASAYAASTRIGAVYQQAVLLIGFAMATAGVMVVGALLYIRRWISDPLLRLADCMHRLATNDTDVDIAGDERGDEIGEMARAALVFRTNAIELMMSQQGLAQQASMLEEKLAAEQKLTLLQGNFVSMASHEFRTPLTIIDGHAQRVLRMGERMTREEIAERAGKVRAAVTRMTHLMDTLLASARIAESDASLYFHPAPVDAVELLHEVCQLHREISPNVQILEDFKVRPLPLVADPKLLHQVFGNLLANAIKYSPGGGMIRVSAVVELDRVAVTFADRGIGIPPADLDRLFERHYRGSNVCGIVGTGLGLYLVKMLVDLHEGTIHVESDENRGSRFTVSLPSARAGVELGPPPRMIAAE
jgi:two-component system OmpR family sensor kinase